MPQTLLPIYPSGLTFINPRIGFEKKDGRIYYFHGLLPVFSHDESDLESFRFITSQLVVGGNVKAIEIAQAFGVSYISVKRNVKRLREQGGTRIFQTEKRQIGPCSHPRGYRQSLEALKQWAQSFGGIEETQSESQHNS